MTSLRLSYLKPSRFLSYATATGNLFRSLFILLTLLFLTKSISAQTLVGSTSGSFSVSKSGEATYSLPIHVPPGIAGIQPSLSLNYSNQISNGFVGIGWVLSGLSSISRCPTTLEQDGFIDGVDFDSNDRFCLDGQRLVPADGDYSNYGAPGKEYRTEINIFSRIISYGAAGSGPAYWIVETRDGNTIEYGHYGSEQDEFSGNALAPASRVEAKDQGGSVLKWTQDKLIDRIGNYYTIAYHEDYANGEQYPVRIDYTRNGSVNSGNAVLLNYELRTDTSKSFVSGAVQRITQRLENIQTYVGSELVFDYRLQYEYSQATRQSRLVSLSQCDASNLCLPATSFSWQSERAGFRSVTDLELPDSLVYTKGSSSRSGVVNILRMLKGQLLDINGDGLVDWVRAYEDDEGTQSKKTWLNTGNGWTYASNYNLPDVITDYSHLPSHPAYTRGQFVDVNADGLPDWVRAYKDWGGTEYIKTWRNTGQGWSRDSDYDLPTVIMNYDSYGWFGASIGQFIDVNGDGLIDWVRAYENKSGTQYKSTWLNTGSGWSRASAYDLPDVIMDYDQIEKGLIRGEFVDVNGDGLPDWVRAYTKQNGTEYKRTWLNTGSGWQSNDDYILPTVIMNYKNYKNDTKERVYQNGEFVDVNGDGLADWVRAYENKSGTQYKATWLNTGHGWSRDSDYDLPDVITDYDNDDFKPGMRRGEFIDANGDGLLDWVRAYIKGNGTEYIKTWLNTGHGWVGDTDYNWPNSIMDYSSYDSQAPHRIVHTNGRAADFNGDGIVDWACSSAHCGGTGDHLETWVGKSAAPDFLKKITDAYGAETLISYQSLTDNVLYKKGSNATYPERDMQVPTQVVSRVRIDNGVGGYLSTRYLYEGMKEHLRGRGGLGFAKVTVVDEQTGIQNITEYRQDFPHRGSPFHSESRLANDQLLNQSDSSYAYLGTIGSTPIFPYVSQSSRDNYDFDNGTLLTTITESRVYDEYGNVLTSSSTTSGNGQLFNRSTASTYINDLYNWRVGQLVRVVGTTTGADGSSVTRVTSFDAYDAATGLLLQSTLEPDSSDPSLKTTTIYAYDSFGHQVAKTACSGNVSVCQSGVAESRTTTTSYLSNSPDYPDGVFATSSTNAVGHTESRIYEPKFGNLISLIDPNTLTTSWQYDSLGRKVKEIRSDGTQTITSYAWCNLDCPTIGGIAAKYQVRSQNTGLPAREMFIDKLGRQLRQQSVGYSGETIFVDTHYDTHGRVLQTSEPYFSDTNSNDIEWTTPTYDLFDRQIETSYPRGDGTYLQTYVSFDGFTTTSTDAKGRTRVAFKNAINQTEQIIDPQGNTTQYRYDALGNLTETEDSAGNTVVISYDLRGRKIAMNDPDMGNWSYRYNSFDELISQTDAKGQVTTISYDKLGRVTQRIDNATGAALSNNWVYGNSVSAHNVGKLVSMTGASGTSKSFNYDHFSRLISTTYNIDMDSFVAQQSYDSLGRADITTYPVTAMYSSGFQIQRVYNSHGYLEKVQTTDQTPTVYWEADLRNEKGQVIADMLGNGVSSVYVYNTATGWLNEIDVADSSGNLLLNTEFSYDEVGNLISRTEQRQNIAETFTYDILDRLTTARVSGQTQKTYNYDALGNITNKSDFGTYSYDNCNAGPHAVCSAGGNTYTYDANGNMTNSGDRVVHYTAFNKPRQFVQGGTAISFTYGADKSRLLKVSASKRNRYVGLNGTGGILFEQEYNDATGTRKNIHYIFADGAHPIAQHVTTASTGSTEYFHRDHLGSVEAVSNQSGQVAVYKSFDAWGQRRQAVGWVDGGDFSQSGSQAGGNREFTGHESIPEIGLIHMNGRVYDPLLGRFLSADPHIQAPGDSQSYNRYSYVFNNPLRHTDPSGYFSLKSVFKKVIDHIKNRIDQLKDLHEKHKDFNDRMTNATLKQHFKLHASIAKRVRIVQKADDYLAENEWAQVVVTSVASFFGGPAGAAAASMHIAYAQGASIDDIRRAGRASFVTSYLNSAISVNYGDSYTWSRVFTQSAAGGVSAELNGGKFADGFKIVFGTSLLQLGVEKFKGKYTAPNVSSSPASLGLKPQGADYMMGKVGSNDWFIGARLDGSGAMGFLERYIPGFHSGSAFHDPLVGFFKGIGWGDNPFTNWLTIAPAYYVNYYAAGYANIKYQNELMFSEYRPH